MRTLTDIENMIKSYVTCIYGHVSSSSKVDLPYAVLLEMGSNNIFADNETYQEIIPAQIILHQASRNATLETNIKTALKTNHIPYEYSTEWDNTYLMYVTTFDFNL